MKKRLYVLSVVFLSLCAAAIIVCCAVFSSSQNFGNSEPTFTPDVRFESDDLEFVYGASITLNLGDTLNIAPTVLENVDIYKFSYISKDESVLTIDSGGNVFTNKCGKTIVEIKNHNVIIKRVKIDVDYKFELGNLRNCSFENSKLFMQDEMVNFKVSIVNTQGDCLLSETTPNISTTSGITAFSKMGNIVLSSSKSGAIMLSYPEYNIEILLPIVVE